MKKWISIAFISLIVSMFMATSIVSVSANESYDIGKSNVESQAKVVSENSLKSSNINFEKIEQYISVYNNQYVFFCKFDRK